MAPPKSRKDGIELNERFEMLKPHSADIDGFPDNKKDFAALSAADLSYYSNLVVDEMEYNPITSQDSRIFSDIIKATNEIVSKKEAEELDSLHTELAKAGLNAREDEFPDKENFAKLTSDEIEELAYRAIAKNPKQEETIEDLLEPVFDIKRLREREGLDPLEAFRSSLRGNNFPGGASFDDDDLDIPFLQPTEIINPSKKHGTKERAETKEPAPKKESNRVTFKDAMELKNESIKEKNEEQTWKGNLANRIKGVGRVLYAIPAIPIEGAKGIFNAVRSVPVMAGGALKASWGAIRGNQELKENGISMMSAGGHMALQGATAFIRAPASLIKEGIMNIATGQRQEDTFRAKQHATRITREKGKGNLNLEGSDLSRSSKTTQKIVEKMRSSTAVQQGTTVQQSAAAGLSKSQNTRQSML